MFTFRSQTRSVGVFLQDEILFFPDNSETVHAQFCVYFPFMFTDCHLLASKDNNMHPIEQDKVFVCLTVKANLSCY